MDWMAFAASLVHSLAWPVATALIVMILRKPIGSALGRGVRRLRAGPVEVEFDRELDEVREELRKSPELAAADLNALSRGELSDDLAGLAEQSPRAAVLEAFARIEGRLGELLKQASCLPARVQGARHMARLAWEQGLISDETLAAIDGVSILRNLAAHSPRDDIGVDRARDYLVLADAVLFALRSRPSTPPGSSAASAGQA
jgi:hypothetical protein